MKKLLLLLIISISLFSCKKDQESLQATGNISYKINGVSYNFSNGSVKKITGTPGVTNTGYFMQGFDDNNSANIIVITPSDTLKEKSYHLEYGTAPTFTVGTKGYSILDAPAYYVDVSISSYKNGYVSGTFSGKITHIVSLNPEVLEDADLTQGKFENLRVTYY